MTSEVKLEPTAGEIERLIMDLREGDVDFDKAELMFRAANMIELLAMNRRAAPPAANIYESAALALELAASNWDELGEKRRGSHGRHLLDFAKAAGLREAAQVLRSLASPLAPAVAVSDLLAKALAVLDNYADPTGYSDNDGEQLGAGALDHPGILAKQTADEIRSALAAAPTPPVADAPDDALTLAVEKALRPYLTSGAVWGITPDHRFSEKVLGSEVPWQICGALRSGIAGIRVLTSSAAEAPGQEPVYRFLKEGEIIQKGDECPSDDTREWVPTSLISIGLPVTPSFKTMRRLVSAPTTYADADAKGFERGIEAAAKCVDDLQAGYDQQACGAHPLAKLTMLRNKSWLLRRVATAIRSLASPAQMGEGQ